MDDEEEEFVPPREVTLHDGECWVADPDYLERASGIQGVIAIQFRDGALWYLDGETRKWLNVECEDSKPRPRLRPVN